jgi:glutamine synthetase
MKVLARARPRRLRPSAFLADYFGERFLAIFHAIKSAECERFHARVTELDLDWYLTRS